MSVKDSHLRTTQILKKTLARTSGMSDRRFVCVLNMYLCVRIILSFRNINLFLLGYHFDLFHSGKGLFSYFFLGFSFFVLFF